MSSKISLLPAMTALVGTEQLTGVQAGANRNATPTLIKDFVQPYKVYRAFLTQNGTAAPVATVLENTVGAIVWSRLNPGEYYATLAGAFPDSNKVAGPSINSLLFFPNQNFWKAGVNDANSLQIVASGDDEFTGQFFEIIVYP